MTGNKMIRREKIEAKLRLKLPLTPTTGTVAEINALTNPEEREVQYCSNGNAGAPCLAVYSGGAWLRVVFGAAISAT